MSRPSLSRHDSAALLDSVRRSIAANDLAGASMVVAFSGGPDSTTLLHSLYSLKDTLGLELHAAHLDHGLRPESSEADADFAREFASSLGVPLTTERADTYALRVEFGLSIEEAARRLRYEFLSRVASRYGADCVALGHTLDDQAETVLLNAIRGTGLDGLSAMKETSSRIIGAGRLTLFRPLLSVSKSEILAYCAENGLDPRLDESNLSTEFTRNRIRLDLMPKLEQYNPSIRMALARLASSASMDLDFIRQEVERAARDIVAVDSHGAGIERERFSRLHPALSYHLLRHAVEIVKGDTNDLELGHVSQMFNMMSGASGKSMNLPGGLRFHVDYHFAHIHRPDALDSPVPAMDGASMELRVPGSATKGEWIVSSRFAGNDAKSIKGPEGCPRLAERFDADAIGETPLLRTRKAGDIFQPLGMGSEKKLKDFMIDSHIPRRWRDSVPLVEACGRIAWVVGWRIADWAKISPRTRRVLEMRFEKISDA